MTGWLLGMLLLGLVLTLVTGGLFYLAERPRITYSQAVGRWWIIAISFSVAVLWEAI
jgi:hypothetical protein